METDRRHRNPFSLLAPIALIVFGVALVMVLSSGGGGGGGGSSPSSAEKARDLGTTTSQRHSRRSSRSRSDKLPQNVYVVKRGDTLAGIAETTGVPVARLQELNPGLDQFSLVAGHRIKLR